MNSEVIQLLTSIICSVLASSGAWAFILKRTEAKDVKTQMLMGLGHDRIMHLGMHYVSRGWITDEEYENLHTYLFVPYAAMGGNGAAKRVMDAVDKIEIKRAMDVTNNFTG